MVRIVSGAQDEDPNAALLQGMQLGQSWRQSQQARKEAEGQQLDRQLRMQEIGLRFQKARADREELLNKQAQMGHAQSIQEIALRQKMTPSESAYQDGMKMLQDITDPDARRLAASAIDEIITETRTQEQKAAAMKVISKGIADKIPGSENAEARIATGEEPEVIAKELADASTKISAENVNRADTAKWIEKAQAQIEASDSHPRDKKLAQFELQKLIDSPSTQAEPEAGAKMLSAVNKALTSGRDEQIKNYAARQEQLKTFVAEFNKLDPVKQEEVKAAMQRFGPTEPSDEGMGPFQSGPDDPGQNQAMVSHAASQKAEKEKRYPGSTGQRKPASKMPTTKIRNAKSNKEVLAALKAAGIPITHDSLAEAQNIRGSRAR